MRNLQRAEDVNSIEIGRRAVIIRSRVLQFGQQRIGIRLRKAGRIGIVNPIVKQPLVQVVERMGCCAQQSELPVMGQKKVLIGDVASGDIFRDHHRAALKAVVDEDVRKFDRRHAIQSDVSFLKQVLVGPAGNRIDFEKLPVLIYKRKGRGNDLGFGKLPMRLKHRFDFIGMPAIVLIAQENKIAAGFLEQAGKIADIAQIFVAVQNAYVQIGMRRNPRSDYCRTMITRSVITNEQFVKRAGLAGDGVKLFS